MLYLCSLTVKCFPSVFDQVSRLFSKPPLMFCQKECAVCWKKMEILCSSYPGQLYMPKKHCVDQRYWLTTGDALTLSSSTGYEVPLRTTRAFLLELEKHIFESSSSIAPYLSYINGHRTGSGHDLYVVEKKCWHNTQYDEDCAAQAYLHLFPLRYSGFSCSFPSTSVL